MIVSNKLSDKLISQPETGTSQASQNWKKLAAISENTSRVRQQQSTPSFNTFRLAAINGSELTSRGSIKGNSNPV